MGSTEDQANPILNAPSHSRRISKTRKSNAKHQQIEGSHPPEMKSDLPKVSTIDPDLTKTEVTSEGVVEPVRLHIKLNNLDKRKTKKVKKRSKYSCKKCNIPRFGRRSLFRQHLLSHIDNTTVAVTLNRLRLPAKVVIRASRYYARKHPAAPISDPTNLCLSSEVVSVSPEVISPDTHKAVNTEQLPDIDNPSRILPSTNNCVIKRILEHGESSYSVSCVSSPKSKDSVIGPKSKVNQKSRLDGMANSTSVKQTLPISNESTDDSRGKELMEELGFQMNKLAGSFFRNDMQSGSGMSISQPVEQTLPPPLVADRRFSGENPISISQDHSQAVHSVMTQQSGVQQNQFAHSPNMHSQQTSASPSGAPSPSVTPRLSPHTMTSAYRAPSPQTNGLSVASPRMSPHMTPPLLQRSSPHLPPHVQNLGNISHGSPLASMSPSPMVSQALSMPIASPLPSSRPVMMTGNNVPNERCESVMIIEKPQSSSSSNMGQNFATRTSLSQPLNSAALTMTSTSNSQSCPSTSGAHRNPLALLRQLDPAKSMPTNISLQATSSLEDQSRPASVMILENTRDNPTPKFNIGNVVSLAPGYCNQVYGNAPASSFAPTPPVMPHLLQDISSNCTCNTCTDIRSGDLIRRAQIMIQAGHYEYKCPMCVRRFAHKSSLLRHTRSFTHGYVCDLCSSGFLSKVAFECHQQLHEEKSISSPSAGVNNQLSTSAGVHNQMPTSAGVRNQMPTSAGVHNQMPTSVGVRNQMPTAAGVHNQLSTSVVSHQHAKKHPQQTMNPPPPPLLSSMNRRLIMNNANTNRDINSNATMVRQKQLVQPRPESNSMMQINKNVVDDDVIVVGIERRQPVSRPMGRTLPPPPPLERAPRPNFTAVNNRQLQDRINMMTQAANNNLMSRNANSQLSRNAAIQMSQRGGNVRTAAAPLPQQSQLARIFNNSEITLTPIGNEGNVRKLDGITITPTSQPNMRHPPTGNSNMMSMNNNAQMRSRVQFAPRTNVGNLQRFQTPVISNVRHIGPAQTRPGPMPNMNQGFAPNRQNFSPQMQNSRMIIRNVAPGIPARSNQSSNILNNQYMSQLSTAMRQTAHSMNNNSGNRSIMTSRSDTGTHTAYRMMPVANPVPVHLQQSNSQSKQMPTWHHPVSVEAYGTNTMSKNVANRNHSMASMGQGNVRPVQSMQSSPMLPSNSHSSGPNRFPIPVQQVQVPTSRQMQPDCSQNRSAATFIAQSTGGLSSIQTNAQNQSHQVTLKNPTPNMASQVNCPVCSMKFNSPSEFQDHCRQKHNGNVQSNKPDSLVKCLKCQEQFDVLSLKNHELTCQEKIPCIRCNMLICQDKWADHCTEFHTGETQGNVSSITLTNPFENNSEVNAQIPSTAKENCDLRIERSTNDDLGENKVSPSCDENQQALHSSLPSQEHSIPTSTSIKFSDELKSSDNDGQHGGLNSQDCNPDAPTDDDVLVHDLTMAAASEIQLINDTVMDIGDNGGTKMPSVGIDATSNSLPEEDEQIVIRNSELSSLDFNSESEKSEMPISGNSKSSSQENGMSVNLLESSENEEIDPLKRVEPSDVLNHEVASTSSLTGTETAVNEEIDPLKSGEPSDVLNHEVASTSFLTVTETATLAPASNSELSTNLDNLNSEVSINDGDLLEPSELDDEPDEGKDVHGSSLVNEDCDTEPAVDPGLQHCESQSHFRLSLDLDDDDMAVEDDFPISSGSETVTRDDHSLVCNFPISENNANNDHDSSSSQLQENITPEFTSCAMNGDVGDEQQHSENECSRDESKMAANIEQGKSFLCPICDQVLSSKKEFLNHITIHQTPQTCHLCNSTFNTRKKLVLHLRSHMKSCSKARQSTFTSPTSAAKRPRRDSGSSTVGIVGSSKRSDLMVALLDMNKISANVGLLQRMGVVGLVSLSDLQLHIGSGTLLNNDSNDPDNIPIVNLTND